MTERTGQLAPLAIHQLRAWEEIAHNWVVIIAARDGEWHCICPNCDQSILPLKKENTSTYYVFTNNELLAATVAHLRNRHRDLDPDHE